MPVKEHPSQIKLSNADSKQLFQPLPVKQMANTKLFSLNQRENLNKQILFCLIQF